MKITIIGWYGTETIGDRAILAGLISIFNQAYDEFEVKLGSLNPFFSVRTIDEDRSLYEDLTGKKIDITIFNVKNSKDLSAAINDSTLVAMGGGPLMDLSELFMVEYAFKLAKKNHIKTALLGCGIGPLFQDKFKVSVFNIIKNSDLVILRDAQSKINLQEIFKQFRQDLNSLNVHVGIDPAVECCIKYSQVSTMSPKKYIAVNVRDFPIDYSETDMVDTINDKVFAFVKKISKQYSDREIRLIPMSYFYLGCDDREFLNRIILQEELGNVVVQNRPLTLKSTMSVFQGAYFSIGMRFHSVVFQTILSGKNFILDYTEPRKGKIYGFIEDIDKGGFYKNRYSALQEKGAVGFENIEQNVNDIFPLDMENIDNLLYIYVSELKLLKKGIKNKC
jgi:polysaccharide pyruvyl transferase WcaK-like protein